MFEVQIDASRRGDETATLLSRGVLDEIIGSRRRENNGQK
jgi:hypothetical protein